MQAAEIHTLLRVHESCSKENALRKAWNATHSTCKDVVALAFPLKPIPHTLDAFRNVLAASDKQKDFVIANFYVVYVGQSDGQEWGWSKAPYDNKNKKREEQKALYTADTSVQSKGQTRFWSFKKVSNNMNKGPRVDDKIDDKDISFVLPGGACMSVFLREDKYEENKLLFDGVWDDDAVIPAYTPVLLQLSGTNDEQALKGNGLKLRRVLPVAKDVINGFCDSFFESKAQLHALQTETADMVPLHAVTKAMQGCPLLCRVHENAFVYRDREAAVVEILESGMDPDVGKRLLVPEHLLLSAMNSQDVDRAIRMLSVAIGHKAVKCIFVQASSPGQNSTAQTTDACTVVHLHVDMAETMWFNVLHKSRIVDSPTGLPKTQMLTMCFGSALQPNEQAPTFVEKEENKALCLQWFSPGQQVQVATKEGGEVLCNVVFEMELEMKQSAGQREVHSKVLFMDEVAGFHYVVKVFHAQNVVYTEQDGLACEHPKLLVTWQFRPGLVSSTLSVQGIQRKREYMSADTFDEMNCGLPLLAMQQTVCAPAKEESNHKRRKHSDP